MVNHTLRLAKSTGRTFIVLVAGAAACLTISYFAKINLNTTILFGGVAALSSWRKHRKIHTISKRKLASYPTTDATHNAAQAIATKFRVRRWHVTVNPKNQMWAGAYTLRAGLRFPWSAPDGLIEIGSTFNEWIESSNRNVRRAALAVLAHEFAHLEERHAQQLIAAACARAAIFGVSAFALAVNAARTISQSLGANDLTNIDSTPVPITNIAIVAALAFWGFSVLKRSTDRSAEYAADAMGAATVGSDAMIAALTALSEGHATLWGKLSTFTDYIVGSTHPTHEKRIARLKNSTKVHETIPR